MNFSPPPLHIPDGFLSSSVSILCWLLTAIIIALAIRKTSANVGERLIPLMGVMSAFIFAAQMINFPIAGGTSGHLIGGTLAVVTLGPWAGMVVMTSVIALQGLLFQDGGLLAMGANILNMGILATVVSYGLIRIASPDRRRLWLILIGVAAWMSVITGSLATSLELWLSGTARLDIIVPSMTSIHALIGIGEALITVSAVSFVQKVRPDLLSMGEYTEKLKSGWIITGLLITLIVLILSPLASIYPDGLEKTAEDLGFLRLARESSFKLFPNYQIGLLNDSPISVIAAGLIGIGLILAIAATLNWVLIKIKKTGQGNQDASL